MADVVIEEMNFADLLEDMNLLHVRLQEIKPNDRSEKDRVVAVTLTDLEKVIAYFKMYVVEGR